MKKSPNINPEKLPIIDRISMVIHLRLSLDDYNFGSKLALLTDEIVPQTKPPSKRGLRIKYKHRQAHQDESKDIEVNDSNSKSDTPQADQPQSDAPADAPADTEEELMEDLEDLSIDEPVIEPITAESLKRSHHDAFSQL